MEYLPSALETEDIWRSLRSAIVDRLSKRAVLQSRSRRVLKTPGDLRFISKDFKYNGEPMLADLPGADLYISEQYSFENIMRLKPLGLRAIHITQCIDRIKHDTTTPASHLRNTDLDDEWHTAFLSLISSILGTSYGGRVKELQIIPLSTGEWVSQNQTIGDPVYLPYAVDEDSVKVEIPGNIGLRKLHTNACVVRERRSVYASLGICDCDPSVIVKKVLLAQRSVSGPISDYVQRFEVLFWFNGVSMFGGFGTQELWAVDEKPMVKIGKKLFFRSPKAYDAADLLCQTPIADLPRYGFIHDLYIKSPVRDFRRHSVTWQHWLENAVGVRYYPELLDEGHRVLHPLLKITARDDSAKFLAALKEHWKDSYAQTYQRYSVSSSIKTQLRDLTVHCCNGQTSQLSDTILPSPEAISKSRDFGVESQLLLLSLPSDAFASGVDDWSFLGQFGVICEPNLSFHFKALESLRLRVPPRDRKHDAITRVYRSIVNVAKLGDAAVLQVRVFSGIDNPSHLRFIGAILIWWVYMRIAH